LFLFFGSITKSAQIPFSAWLPAAIAAPTPVSSLVHSSTLVTAGVYVLIRFNYLFIFFTINYFKFFFVFTMLLAGVCAVLEKDFKKIVAISTLSQLGIIMFILSVGGWILSFLHIIIHAFFKRMLFLRTGSLIRQIVGGQDSRFYGRSILNYGSFIYFRVRRLCLAGFPFFLGFYSKDFIISSSSVIEGFIFFFVFLLGCLTTVIYRIRLIWSSYILMFKYNRFYTSLEEKIFFYSCNWVVFEMLVSRRFYVLIIFIRLFVFFFVFWFIHGFDVIFFRIKLFFYFTIFLQIFFYVWDDYIFMLKICFWYVFFYKKVFFYSFEGTWIEVLGGIGTYSYILKANKYVVFIRFLRLGLLIFSVFVLGIYIY